MSAAVAGFGAGAGGGAASFGVSTGRWTTIGGGCEATCCWTCAAGSCVVDGPDATGDAVDLCATLGGGIFGVVLLAATARVEGAFRVVAVERCTVGGVETAVSGGPGTFDCCVDCVETGVTADLVSATMAGFSSGGCGRRILNRMPQPIKIAAAAAKPPAKARPRVRVCCFRRACSMALETE